MRVSQRVALLVVLLMSVVSAQQSPDQSLARLKPVNHPDGPQFACTP